MHWRMGLLPYIICGPTASSALHFLPSLVMKQEKLFFLRKKVVVCACSKDESSIDPISHILIMFHYLSIYLDICLDYDMFDIICNIF